MLSDVFDNIFKNNLWKSPESRSGQGSELAMTENVRRMLPVALRFLNAKSLLDASCGDFNWMKEVDLGEVSYQGCDISREAVAYCQKYSRPGRTFFQANITRDNLPAVDLILCRCTLYHLSNKHIFDTLKNFKYSGSKYLLVTNMPRVAQNKDIQDGSYRRLNLEIAPFNLSGSMFLFEDSPGKNEYLTLYPVDGIEV